MSLKKIESCLFGGAYGEYLGSQVENMKSEDIKKIEIFKNGIFSTKKCTLTDDWEMTMGLAKAIIKYKRIECFEIHNSYIENFNEQKGYSQSTRNIFLHMKSNGFVLNPGNSINDGCLMRISPLAISGNENIEILREQVTKAIYFTHNTQESITCTTLYCALLQHILYHKTFDEENVKKSLLEYSDNYCNELYTKLQLTFICLEKDEKCIEEVLLGTKNHMQIKAVDCFCCGIYYFLKYKNNPYNAVQKCIYGGGDTDTVAKIVGELCGAYTGNIEWIPQKDIDFLETTESIKGLSEKLYKIKC